MRQQMRAVLAGALLATLGAGATACAGAAEPPGESSITIGVAGIGTLYDPSQGAARYAALNLDAVYDTLLVTDSNGDLQPWLATEYRLSDDRLTASFTLRDDVDFTDGVHLDAAGVVSYYDTLFDSETYWYWDRAGRVYGMEFALTGEYTFDVTATAPLDGSAINAIAVYTPVTSPEAIKDPESLAVTPVGSGPYLIDEVVPDVSATFVRNPGYWNPGAYPFDTVTLTVFSDDVAALNALKSGQIDAAKLSTPNAVEAAAEGFAISAAPARYVALWFADRGGELQPAIADVRVRQAISLAFDREQINESLNLGYGVVTDQPFAESQAAYVEGGDDRYGYDVGRARELMAEAGYADGFDLAIPSTTFLGINALEPVVAQALGEIGIRVTFVPTADAGEFFTVARDGSYPVLLYNEAYDFWAPNFLDPDGFWNYLGYVDPVAAEFVRTIRQGSEEERLEAESRLGEYALEQAWLAVFSSPETLYASDPSIAVDLAAGNSGEPYLLNFQRAE